MQPAEKVARRPFGENDGGLPYPGRIGCLCVPFGRIDQEPGAFARGGSGIEPYTMCFPSRVHTGVPSLE